MPYPTGDINQDGTVDVFDLSILVSRWGTSDPDADLNGDGTVDAFDLSILVGNWGETTSVTTFAIRVVDSNEEPISGATVELAPSGGGAVIADISGTFGWITFTDVPVGTYILTATKTDYEDTIINNFLVAEGMSDPWITMAVVGNGEPEPDPDPDPDPPGDIDEGQPSVLTQPTSPYGSSWLPNDITYPTVNYVNNVAKLSGTSIWGIYTWMGEYKALRHEINSVGWKTIRVSGSNFDDELMTMLAQDGMKLLRNINSSLRRDSYPSNQAYIDALKAEVTQELNRWGPNGTFWSQNQSVPYRPMDCIIMINEPNFSYMWRNGSYEQRRSLYAELVPQLHDHIHQWSGVTTIAYNAGDASRAGNAWFRDVSADLAAAGNLNKFDTAAHQPYTGTVAPDLKYDQFSGWSHGRNVNDYRQHIQNNGRNAQQVPWLWTEGGWVLDPSAGGTFDRAGMTNINLWASHYVRMYLIGMRMGLTSVLPMYITDSDNYNGGFFKSMSNKAFRPNATALQSMISLMPNPVLHSAIHDGPDDFLHRYYRNGPGTSIVACAWRATGRGTMSVPVQSGNVIVTDMLGNKGSISTTSSSVTLNVGPLPIFVES